MRRLQGVAEAALTGGLDRYRLLMAPSRRRSRHSAAIKGIGPFWAEGILLRAVGTTDALPLGEKRGRAVAAEAYGTPEVVDDEGRLPPWPRAGGRFGPGSPSYCERRPERPGSAGGGQRRRVSLQLAR